METTRANWLFQLMYCFRHLHFLLELKKKKEELIVSLFQIVNGAFRKLRFSGTHWTLSEAAHSHQSLPHIRIQNLHVVRGGNSGGFSPSAATDILMKIIMSEDD